jgi:hypothetical protein
VFAVTEQAGSTPTLSRLPWHGESAVHCRRT